MHKQTVALLLFMVLLSAKSYSQAINKVNWLSITELESKMQHSPRKVFVHIYTPWCGWCKKMQKTSLANPANVTLLNQNYYCIMLNAETNKNIRFGGKTYRFDPEFGGRKNGTHELVQHLLSNKVVYPASVILNTDLSVSFVKRGSSNTENLNTVLNRHLQ